MRKRLPMTPKTKFDEHETILSDISNHEHQIGFHKAALEAKLESTRKHGLTESPTTIHGLKQKIANKSAGTCGCGDDYKIHRKGGLVCKRGGRNCKGEYSTFYKRGIGVLHNILKDCKGHHRQTLRIKGDIQSARNELAEAQFATFWETMAQPTRIVKVASGKHALYRGGRIVSTINY
jgi:hypothetical protein